MVGAAVSRRSGARLDAARGAPRRQRHRMSPSRHASATMGAARRECAAEHKAVERGGAQVAAEHSVGRRRSRASHSADGLQTSGPSHENALT